MSSPQLSELSAEQRRVLCAKLTGWKFQKGTGIVFGGKNIPRGWINPQTGKLHLDAPNPDESHDDAFKLVEFMRAKGWQPIISVTTKGEWWCVFDNLQERHTGRADTAPQAIVSAFLLATGAAL